jgi:adenine deaminase
MLASYVLTGKQKMKELMKVALGEAQADLAVIGGDVLNVYTGELLKEIDVLVKGDTIAYVGKKTEKSIGPSTEIIDAHGKVLIPGLIDGHTHVDDLYPVDELVKYALTGCTTTIITETSAVCSVLGYAGVVEFVESLRNQPVKFFVTLPPIITTSFSVNKYSVLKPLEMKRLLGWKEVVGLGEISWAQMNESLPRLYDYVAWTLKKGKQVDGHSAGARDNKLQAFFATGISSCHEPITAEEVLERLRLGLLVLIREGAVRKELKEISKIKDKKVDFRGLAISSDAVDPRQLVRDGYMNFIVQKAINSGFNPVVAIQMATINVATHFGLDFIGGIAPGKIADIVVIPDLKTISAKYVITNGKLVVSDNELVTNPRKHIFSPSVRNTIRLQHDFSAGDFIIRVTNKKSAKVRVIAQISDLVTGEAIIEMPVTDGLVRTDINQDILKVASIDRYWATGKFGLGLIKGFGLKKGAIGTSSSWDCGHICVIGANEADMADVVNRIRKLQGGTVIIAGGKILAELSLPIAGLFSEEPIQRIAEKFDEIQNAAEKLGTRLTDVRMSLQVLTSPSIPFLRICEEGLFDLKQNKLVDLIVN